MYIEFRLLQRSDRATARSLGYIKQYIESWSSKYQITQYKQKTIKHTHRITFDADEYYTLFSLTWNPERLPILDRWRIVSDLNNKI